jgi:hypothetical protein
LTSVNDRLLSEIQASVDTQQYDTSKRRQYFKEFQLQKTEEERQRSIEEAKDLKSERHHTRLRDRDVATTFADLHNAHDSNISLPLFPVQVSICWCASLGPHLLGRAPERCGS